MSGFHVDVTSVGLEGSRLELVSLRLNELAGLASTATDVSGATGGEPVSSAIEEFSDSIATLLAMLGDSVAALSSAVRTAGNSYHIVDAEVMNR